MIDCDNGHFICYTSDPCHFILQARVYSSSLIDPLEVTGSDLASHSPLTRQMMQGREKVTLLLMYV